MSLGLLQGAIELFPHNSSLGLRSSSHVPRREPATKRWKRKGLRAPDNAGIVAFCPRISLELALRATEEISPLDVLEGEEALLEHVEGCLRQLACMWCWRCWRCWDVKLMSTEHDFPSKYSFLNVANPFQSIVTQEL